MPDCLADFRNAGFLTEPSTAAAIVERLQPQYRHHMQGEAILDSNNPNKLVVLTSGSVLVEQRGPDGQYFSVAIRRAPEVIGELEYLTNHTGPGDFRVSGLEQGEAWLVTYPQI